MNRSKRPPCGESSIGTLAIRIYITLLTPLPDPAPTSFWTILDNCQPRFGYRRFKIFEPLDSGDSDTDTHIMAFKVIAPFTGPLTPTANDGFAIYDATKAEKAPSLAVMTKIRPVGSQMHELSTGRADYLKYASWESFEKQVRARFMPKGYKLLCPPHVLPLLTERTQFYRICISSCRCSQRRWYHSYPCQYLQVSVLIPCQLPCPHHTRMRCNWDL